MIHYKIKEKVAQTGATLQEVADIIHVNKSTVSKFLKGDHELKFEALFRLISSMFPLNEQPEAFRNTFLHVTNKRNVKCALEFFSANRDTESLSALIEQNKNKFKDMHELFYLYEFISKYRRRIITRDRAYRKLIEFHPSTAESKLLHSLFLMFWNIEYKQFRKIILTKEMVFHALDELEDGYFKTSLRNQFLENYLSYYGHNYDREEINNLLTLLEGHYTNHYNQGLVTHWRALYYQWDDCEKTIQKFNECIQFYYAIGANRYGDFVKYECLYLIMIYYGLELPLEEINKAPDYIQAYYFYRKGNLSKSKELLESCKNRIQDENDLLTLPYQFYLEGLITQNSNYFWLSMYQFFAEGDLLFAMFPIEELKKSGLSEDMVHHLLKTEREKKLLSGNAPALY
ncbi:AimR family lysis-lysogeny pheromone receptor [Bacillus suaedaesalsae]|uniref:AimR family lysis-lysogeny pheromone receptor n=1 Tax=Bacillus suaedaesalsae TaxID=2810349 RepID=A0ABS2DF35_9BACI|nr:AimR family lysis-lysogeny pheromone receptor [Bacillus suaedaesalsae]MBM6616635.1 AimR family lysis-lysogeny pheromone receptor [Bacillus suaedaesalsae]